MSITTAATSITPSSAMEMIPYDTHGTMPSPPPVRPVAAGIVARHLAKRQAMYKAASTRGIGSAMATTRLLLQGRGGEFFMEMLEIQKATQNELVQQQQSWFQGLESLMQQWNQIDNASSLASLVTQECNLIVQFGNLATAQMTDFVAVVEGLTVGYGFWVEEASARDVAVRPSM